MELFSSDATIFEKKKVERTTLKNCSEILKFFFHPELPKWPKQKNSCFQMLLIDQLYIELGV